MSLSTPSILDFHRRCRALNDSILFQEEQIRISRQQYLDRVNFVQAQRCLSSLRSGFCLRISASNVRDIIHLPFFKPDAPPISDQVSGIGSITAFHADMTRFLQSIYKALPQLPQFLANVSPQVFFDPAPYLPSSIKPREFVGCSTIPALFGHCWSADLRHAYIKFLIKTAKHLPPSVFANFKDHWLFECFRSYIHSSEIQVFLKLSIGDVLLQIIRDKPTDLGALVGWVGEMVTRMQSNIATFPTDVRILLRKFGAIAEDPATRLNYIELLFMECIATPAVSTPKAYYVLPPTFHLDLSSDGPLACLHMLAKLFHCVLHAKQGGLLFPDIDVAQLERIPLGAFLTNLTSIPKSDEIVGPSMRSVGQSLATDTTFLLFTVPDICLLAKLLNSEDFPLSRKIPVDRRLDFDFFRYSISSQALGLTPFPSEKPAPAPSCPLSAAAASLFGLLRATPECSSAPPDLGEFLAFHEGEARRMLDCPRFTRLSHFSARLSAVAGPERPKILYALEDEIGRQGKRASQNASILGAIARGMMALDAEVDAYRRRAEQAFAVLTDALLTLFLETDTTVQQVFLTRREEFLVEKDMFMGFLTSSLTKLRQFLAPISDQAFPKAAAHFHTWMMQRMPLMEFIAAHPGFPITDGALSTVTKDVIHEVCVVPSPPKLKTIFANPPLFQFSLIELLNAEFLEFPLEAIERITAARSLIEKMFELSFGEMPQADEMTPLFTYALLASGLSRIFSFHRYLEHFLAQLPPGDVQFLDNTRSVALTHFIGHVSSLDEMLKGV
jgi:hypothetical protein